MKRGCTSDLRESNPRGLTLRGRRWWAELRGHIRFQPGAPLWGGVEGLPCSCAASLRKWGDFIPLQPHTALWS